MNLQHLIYFQALAHYQHMALTAERLDITQPTLSYAIRRLEDELGVPLFEKEGRNIKLSIYGATFLKYVEKSLSALDDGKTKLKDLSSGNSGEIRLGVSSIISDLFLAKMIGDFKKEHSETDIDFSIERAAGEPLLFQLENEQLDIGLLTLADAASTQRKWQDLQTLPLVNLRLVAIIPKSYPLAQAKKVTLSQLAPYSILTFSKDSGIRQRLDRLWQRKSIRPNVRLETNSISVISAMVADGQGVAIVPRDASLENIDKNKVVQAEVADDVDYRIYLVTKTPSMLSRITTTFHHFAEAYCIKHADELG
jgi:LysR family transcriptional activator of glutamate synthase operon